MKRFLTAVSSVLVTLFAAYSQSVVEMHLPQNPLFEVSTNTVNAGMPEGSASMTIGADLVIKGGSGTYAYRWYTAAGEELGKEATLTITGIGTYLLDVTDTCDCLQTVEFKVSTASINDVEAPALQITPNPTRGYIELSAPAVQLTATDMAGRLAALIDAAGETFTSADLSRLSAGTYIVAVTDATGNVFTTKLIKK